MSATSPDRHDLAALAALGAVPERQQERVAARVEADPAFAALVAEYTELLAALDEPIAPADEPPPGLEQRVVAAVSAARPAPAAGMPRWAPWVGGAAAVLLVVVGVAQLSGGSVPGAGGPRREAVAVQVAGGLTAEVELVAQPWGTEVLLVVEGTTTAANYAVELVDVRGLPASAGSFVGAADRAVEARLHASLFREEVAALRVTDETGAVVVEAAVPPRDDTTPGGIPEERDA